MLKIIMKTKMEPVQVTQVKFSDNFWAERLETNREVTLPIEYKLLKKTGRLGAFNPKAATVHEYWDSDVAKWLEAAAYSLAVSPDKLLQRRVDAVVSSYVNAQLPDGYLNSYYQRIGIDKRWSNLHSMHELYCAGHLMEAAAARAVYSGEDDFLQALCRYADHIAAVFGTARGQKRGYPGHPEIELALIRLYKLTGEQRYLDLAAYFVDERGQLPYYFNAEAKARGDRLPGACAYMQAHLPMRKQKSAEGHAVRACYLYAAMVDVAVERDDKELLAVCRDLWRNITTRRMYITGGVGSSQVGERFTVDYDLPNEDAYAETCAAIALVFFAQRMLNADLDSSYADTMERALYNGVAAGVSRDGTKFFYANRLAVYPELIEKVGGGYHNYPASRQKWFDCSCCPPNIARLYASLGAYVASSSAKTVALHLYAAGRVSAHLECGTAKLAIEGDYPWDGTVSITVTPPPAGEKFTIALRLPGWCRNPAATFHAAGSAGTAYTVLDLSIKTSVKLADTTVRVIKGYLHITRCWQAGDKIELNLPMEPVRLAAHPSVRQNAGQVALQRGPLVYCLEECDNGKDLAAISLPANAELHSVKSAALGGYIMIKATAKRKSATAWSNTLYAPADDQAKLITKPITMQAIPYCLWDNRKPGEMRVWINETERTL
ncbi:MAG: glycoside hydrolase family 127 protein [Lentisphaerae bacterium]|nr:glycoside hydrolase family 127 protein [Lentisphaerota bacterium]